MAMKDINSYDKIWIASLDHRMQDLWSKKAKILIGSHLGLQVRRQHAGTKSNLNFFQNLMSQRTSSPANCKTKKSKDSLLIKTSQGDHYQKYSTFDLN